MAERFSIYIQVFVDILFMCFVTRSYISLTFAFTFPGPCGGKTTGQARLCTFFENMGWKVNNLPNFVVNFREKERMCRVVANFLIAHFVLYRYSMIMWPILLYNIRNVYYICHIIVPRNDKLQAQVLQVIFLILMIWSRNHQLETYSRRKSCGVTSNRNESRYLFRCFTLIYSLRNLRQSNAQLKRLCQYLAWRKAWHSCFFDSLRFLKKEKKSERHTRELVSGGSYCCEFDRTVVFPLLFQVFRVPETATVLLRWVLQKKNSPDVLPFSRVCRLL